MDGDLQHNPKDINKLIKVFEKTECDIVIDQKTLIIGIKFKLIRFVISKLLNQFFNVLFNKKILDPMSGFFILKESI